VRSPKSILKPSYAVARKLFPNATKQLRCCYRLAVDYGQYRSIKRGLPVLVDGSPIPWFTYPAIEYLEQIDLSDKNVFEWGSGNSTRYWAARCRSATAIENQPSWFDSVASDLAANARVWLRESPDGYVNAISSMEKAFDIIVIDGIERERCAAVAADFLSESGFIILDNSDWHPLAAKSLRTKSLIQVDFAGFGPVNEYAWTTSFFLRRHFDFHPRMSDWPRPAIGGLAR